MSDSVNPLTGINLGQLNQGDASVVDCVSLGLSGRTGTEPSQLDDPDCSDSPRVSVVRMAGKPVKLSVSDSVGVVLPR